ncbi:hypothetical protein ACHAQH_004983 [Verticillium albo-atrum]
MKATSSLLLSITALAGLVGTSSGAVLPTEPEKVVLRPVRRPAGLKSSLTQGLDARQAANVPALPELTGTPPAPIVLKPIPRPQILQSSLATGLKLKARQDTLTPAKAIVLGYAADDMTALVDAALKQPAVALEEVDGIASVKCKNAAIDIKFSDAASLKAATSAWPKSDFIIVTYSPEGGCNTADERGWYTVSELTFDEATLVATATSERSALDEQSEEAVVNFDTTPAAAAKRDITASVSTELSGKLIDTENLKIAIDEAHFESNIHIAGSFSFNFLKFKPSKMTMDVDYSGLVGLNLSTHVGASYSTDVYNFEPFAASVSAFSIPGILDVGPIASFGLGVEFAAEGSLDATLGLHSEIPSGKVHLDLVDSDKSTTSGWEPVTSVSTDVSAEVSLQLNPYLDLNLAMGIRAFKGAIDLTAGVDVKPQVINAFSADLNFEYTSQSGFAFTHPKDVTCPNGAWFASTFNFDVVAYIGTLFSKTLYNYNHPIYQSQCWNFA